MDVSKYEKMFREFIQKYSEAEQEAQDEAKQREAAEKAILKNHNLSKDSSDNGGKTIHIHIS